MAVLGFAMPAQARSLGGGNASFSPVIAVTDAATVGAQQAAALARQSMASMTRATQALQAMRNVQAAARAAAASDPGNGSIPNGLAGLVKDPRIAAGNQNLWINAKDPLQTVSGGQTTVTIEQTAPHAVMTWQKFDVGAQTTLVYDQQGNRDWIALNRIDATAAPSRIAGQIKADGTVLIINPNGIIFTGTSQVNLNSLIATTHDITTVAAATAFGQNPPNYVMPAGQTFLAPPTEEAANQYFVANGLFTLSGDASRTYAGFSLGNSLPGTAQSNLPALGKLAIAVQPGAIINGNASGSNDGGFIALMAPNVINSGSITVSNGSVHLVAGANALLQAPLTTDTGVAANVKAFSTLPILSNGLPLPTLDIGVVRYAHATPFGTAINDANALLVARTGLVDVQGDTLRQLGGIDVTTGLSRPGAVNLSGNVVTLEGSSITSILPTTSGETIPAGTLTDAYFRSNLQPTITLSGITSTVMSSGALIAAPAAAVTIGGSANVVLASGSVIDLSGLTTAMLPMSSNLLSILVTKNEIADYPLASGLIGKTVVVDARLSGTRADGTAWVGSPIVNAAGYANSLGVPIDQVLSVGGSLTVTGGWTAIQQPGSVLNLSGGYVTYTGGMINTTKLLGSNGRRYDIGSADENQAYTIVNGFTVNHAHWRIADNYVTVMDVRNHYEPGYIAGRSAGALNVDAVNPILEGTTIAEIVSGRRQRAMAQGGGTQLQTSLDRLPSGAALTIKFDLRAPGDPQGYTTILSDSATSADPYDLANFNSATLQWMPQLANGVFPIFTDAISAAGFASVSISGAYDLSVAASARLTVRPGGSITLNNVSTVNGVLRAPSGSIALNGFRALVNHPDFVPPQSSAALLPPTAALTLGPNAILDVSGLWINDGLVPASDQQGAAFIDGGSVSVTTYKISAYTDLGALVGGTINSIVIAKDATPGIVLAPGSIIDASSGGYISATGKPKMASNGLAAGKGGSVSLMTYANTASNGWAPATAAVAATDLTVTDRLGNKYVIRQGTTYQVYSSGVAGDLTNLLPTTALGADFLPDNGTVVLDGTIYANGFSGGGTFTLQAPSIAIDDAATTTSSYAKPSVNAALATQLGGRFGIAPSLAATWLGNAGPAPSAAAGTVVLPPAFFAQGGFANYSLQSTYGGVTVTSDTRLAPVQNNYLMTSAAYDAPTGSSPRTFAPVVTLPVGMRAAANLTLAANLYIYEGALSQHGLTVDSGASISVDPQGSVTLTSDGLARILGSIHAPGGSISAGSNLVGNALWIGANAVLDTSGVFVPDTLHPTAAGTLLDAGDISLNASTMVVQAGATLLLGGAAATVESRLGMLGGISQVPVWSRGGDLTLAPPAAGAAGANIYFAGSVSAAGGAPQAMGGSFTLGAPVVGGVFVGGVSDAIVERGGVNVAMNYQTTPLSVADLGKPSVAGSFINVDTLNNSGFDAVTISANNIGFVGSIAIRVPGALTLAADKGNLTLLPDVPAGQLLPTGFTSLTSWDGRLKPVQSIVDLTAGYVRLVGAASNTVAASPSDGVLNVNANWIDLQRHIGIADAATVNLSSMGAIRLLPDTYQFILSSIPTTASFRGSFNVAGSLTMTAAEIFPASNTLFLLQSVTPSGQITIKQSGVAQAPLSAGGGLYLNARTITQNGTLWAPFGNIVVGLSDISQLPDRLASGTSLAVTTDTVILGNGSVTSVSGAGLMVPDGTTVDGANWSVGFAGNVITAPPAKQVSFNAANLQQQSGAVIDISGGGDIYATEFVAGTGGSRNVLTNNETTATATPPSYSVSPQYADGRQVYALVPSYTAPVAAYDSDFGNYPYFSGQTVKGNSVTSGIPVGTAVTIAAGNGIPAGTYTLLPGMYATLPGAYRVVQVGKGAAGTGATSTTSADGSQYLSGYMTNALTGGRDALAGIFQVQSDATWSRYSHIDVTGANSYFSNLAAANGTVVPRLPQDGGLVSLGASTSLSLLGSFSARPAPGGRGGVIAISADSILVKSADLVAPAGTGKYLVLDADQLSATGAGQIVIGGRVSYGTSGEIINAQATNVEVMTDDAHPLTGSSIVLTSRAGGLGITVDSGSTIASAGDASAVDNTPIVAQASATSNFGSMLIVSAGGLLDVSRSFTPNADPTTTPGTITVGTAPGSATVADDRVTTLRGGSLTLETSGSLVFGNNLALSAADNQIIGAMINIGDAAPKGGVRLGTADLARFAGANSLRLRSASVFNLYDQGGLIIGDALRRIGTLTFDGAGFYSAGGNTLVNAANIALINSRGATGVGIGGAGGTLTFEASASIVDGVGAKSFGGLNQVNWNAGQAVYFSDTGSIDSGPAAGAALLFNIGGVTLTNGGSGYTSVPTVVFTGGGGTGAAATATLGVVGFASTAKGSNYTSVPTVTISGGGGTGATATAVLGVATITVTAGGSGYANGAPVTVTGPGGSQFTGTAVVDGTGKITGVTIINPGSGFTGAVTSVVVAGGSGATFTASLGVVGITQTSAGTGYTGVPTVTLSGGGGSGATLVGSLGVVGVTITNAGTGYTDIPSMSFAVAGASPGTGASAQALGAVTGITVTNPGDGYAGSPSVTISGGGGTTTTAVAAVSGGKMTGLSLGQAGTGYSTLPAITFDGGGAAMTMSFTAPQLVVRSGANQSVTTTGSITINPVAGAAIASSPELGGTLALTAGSLLDNGIVTARGGNVSMAATKGDIALGGAARIDATGAVVNILDQTSFAPAGNVTLSATNGSVTIGAGAIVDVSAVGLGYAGSVTIATADSGTANLFGTVKGQAAFGDLGGALSINAGHLAGDLPWSAFSGSFMVALGHGDLQVRSGTVLASGIVDLTANDGSVIVDGTIDASGPSGGIIRLFGAGTANADHTRSGGVSVNAGAVLRAAYRRDDPADPRWLDTSTQIANGGNITLGTTGTPDGTYNATYGNENVQRTGSGRIYVDTNALLDLSAGPGGTPGAISIRAPVLADGTVNVSFNGHVANAAGVALNAYATWSSTDDAGQTGSAKHFDGIIDPAGWYGANGKMLDGNWTGMTGVAVSAVTNALTAGYTSAPVVQITGGTGSGATATAVMGVGVNLGTTDPTTGLPFDGGVYTVSAPTTLTQRPTVTITGGGGTTLAKAYPIFGINSITVTNQGAGFDPNNPPTVTMPVSDTLATLSPASLSRVATGTAIIDATGHLVGVNWTDPGVGMLATKTLSIAAPTGGIAASITVSTLKITALRTATGGGITSTPGAGYTSVPTITFSGGTAVTRQASAVTALLQITGLTITNPGTGYTSPPTGIALSGGGAASVTLQLATNLNAAQIDGALANLSAAAIPLLGSGSFMPTIGNANHIAFYQNTLANFVENLFVGNSAAVAAGSFASVDPNQLHLRPEIVLSNPGAAVNAGNITVASNWNLGATIDGTSRSALAYRSRALAANGQISNEPGALTLRALNDILIRATISDGFFTTSANGTMTDLAIAANGIANNPNWTGTTPQPYQLNTTSIANLMPLALGSAGSFSYDLVAGAAQLGDAASQTAPSANPDVVVLNPKGRGNVTIDGHTVYIDPSAADKTKTTALLFIPTLLRTGTGAITLTAANDVRWIDAIRPGAVYSAGRVDSPASNFTAPVQPMTAANSWTGIVTQPVWSTGGGAVRLSAGGSIVGIETPTATLEAIGNTWYFRQGQSDGDSTPFSGTNLQTAAWVNYGSFFQGVGSFGGGDVTIQARRDVTDLSAALPEGITVGGGQVAGSPPTFKTFGGGDLIVRAGGNLNSGAFLVGIGIGDIRVAGAVQVTAGNPVTGLRTQLPGQANVDLGLLLAIQQGFVDLTAIGGVAFSGFYDPTSIAVSGSLLPGLQRPFTSLGVTLPGGSFASNSGASIQSLTGDMILTVPVTMSQALSGTSGLPQLGLLWPANVGLSALGGNVALNIAAYSGFGGFLVGNGYPVLAPSIDGSMSIVAAQSVKMTSPIGMADLLTASSQYVGSTTYQLSQFISPLGMPLSRLQAPLHADDTNPSKVVAGLDITSTYKGVASPNNSGGNIVLLEPGLIEAGRNIANIQLVGENNADGDVTSMIAGQDLTGGSVRIYGPGALLLSAGRNMGPFAPSTPSLVNLTSATYSGILAVGDGSNDPSSVQIKPYLPPQSADIHLLFGVGAGIDYASAISRYVDPSHAGQTGIDLLTDIANQFGQSRQDAWATFQSLPASRQQLLVQHAFVEFLGQVARDYKNSASPYFGQYQRAYDTIATLFPASRGYPAGRDGGDVVTGRLNIAQSLVETQYGSDITVVGPGGGIVVGTSGRDILRQNQQGFLTTAGGSIRIFSDGDIRVNQSRIMTAQGGDIDVFVANGDIDAGSGPKTLITSPSLSLICDVGGFCRINPNGLVSGAGIAALATLPGQDPTKSNVTLAAPRGIIDLGAAGVRAGGNVVLAAIQILNGYNVQAGNMVIGLQTQQSVNTGALTAASNANIQTQTTQAATPTANDRPSVIIVEVLGYGGGDGSTPEPSPDDTYEIKKKQSYNAASPLQVVGLGDMSADQLRDISRPPGAIGPAAR